jgi:glycosyltransferase involved in cell wall biosynthesis
VKVVLDARGVTNQLDGIGRCTLELAGLLTTHGEHEYVVLVRHDLRRDYRRRLGDARQIEVPFGHIDPRTVYGLGRLVDSLGAQVYHSIFMLGPRRMRAASVITVHDVMWLLHPRLQMTGSALKVALGSWYFRRLVGASVRGAAGVVCSSHATLRDITSLWPKAADKFHVVPLGVTGEFQPGDSAQAQRELEELQVPHGRFVLHMSNGKPYKNTRRVIEAMARVPADVTLVITGRRSALSDQIGQAAAQVGVGDRVRLLGNVSNEQVVALLRRATAMVFPSLYEGFGLPVIEAMACGCPVITSQEAALKEVAGDAALLVDPYSSDSIASAVVRVAGDERLREDLRRRGLQRAGAFTWRSATEAVLEVYRQVSGARQ